MSTAQWANIGDDAGALHALVERIANHVAIDAVDYVWIFPARKIAIGESVVVVVGAFDEDPERRRVITARFTVSRNKKGVADVKEKVDEHGAAPTDAVPRIVQGVLRRLGEDAEAEPRAEQIDGDIERWDALVVELGGRPVVREEPAADTEDGTPEEATSRESADGTPGQEAPVATDESVADAALPETDVAGETTESEPATEAVAPDELSDATSPEAVAPADEAAAALDTEHPEPPR
jgi:hypothetical protein